MCVKKIALLLAVCSLAVPVEVSAMESIPYSQIEDTVVTGSALEVQSLFAAPRAVYSDYPFEIEGSIEKFKTLNEAVSYLLANGQSGDILLVGDYTLTDSDSFYLSSGTDITISSTAGAGLYYSATLGNVFTLEPGAKLTLSGNLSVNGNNYETVAPFVQVLPGGELNINDGVIFRNFNSYLNPTAIEGVIVSNQGDTTITGCTIFNNYGNSIIKNEGTLNLDAADNSQIYINMNNMDKDWKLDSTASFNDIVTNTDITVEGNVNIGDVVLNNSQILIGPDGIQSDVYPALTVVTSSSSFTPDNTTGLENIKVRLNGVVYNCLTDGIDYSSAIVYEQGSYNAVISDTINDLTDIASVGFYISSTEENISDNAIAVDEVSTYGIFKNQNGEDITVNATDIEAKDKYIFGLIVSDMEEYDKLYWAPYYTSSGDVIVGDTRELMLKGDM